MFDTELTYLSTANRERIDYLTKVIENRQTSKEERDTALAEQRELESRRKPLRETTYEEAQDFRIFLYTKLRKLSAIGTGIQTNQFQVFIRQVESHIYHLQAEASRKALEEDKNRAMIGKGLRQNDRGTKARRSEVSSGPTRNPWAIPLDDED